MTMLTTDTAPAVWQEGAPPGDAMHSHPLGAPLTGECPGCEAEADRWLAQRENENGRVTREEARDLRPTADDDAMPRETVAALRTAHDALSHRVLGDASALLATLDGIRALPGVTPPEVPGEWLDERDAMRTALRTALRGPAATAVRTALDAMTDRDDDDDRTTAERWATVRPVMRRTAQRALRAAYRAARSRVSSPPYAPTGGDRFRATDRPDPRTYAGPVAVWHGTPAVPAPVATLPVPTTDPDALPAWLTVPAAGPVAPVRDTAPVRTYAVVQRGRTREGGRTTAYVPLAMPPAAALALTGRDLGQWLTGWTSDAVTVMGDRLTALTMGPGPVAQPSTRKRPRGGRIGTPAIIRGGTYWH